MRFIKLGFISLIIIFLLFTIIGLLIPSSVTVVRTQNINAPADSIRYYVNDLYNWKYWLNDYDTIKSIQPLQHPRLVNQQIKYGNYIITMIGIDSNIVTTLWQNKNQQDQISYIKINQNKDGTLITWSFRQHLKWYPWQRFGGMLYDKMLGPPMETGLLKLKQVLEKN